MSPKASTKRGRRSSVDAVEFARSSHLDRLAR